MPMGKRKGTGKLRSTVGIRMPAQPRPTDLEIKKEFYPFHDYLEDGFIIDNELTHHIGEFAYGVALIKNDTPYLAIFDEDFPVKLKIMGTVRECYQSYMKATEVE